MTLAGGWLPRPRDGERRAYTLARLKRERTACYFFFGYFFFGCLKAAG